MDGTHCTTLSRRSGQSAALFLKRQHYLSELQSIISEGIQQNSNCPGVLVALTPPSSIAFGQRWAIVFTIGPNNTHDPSLDNLFCPVYHPGDNPREYLTNTELSFDLNELPRCGLYLGTDDLNQDE